MQKIGFYSGSFDPIHLGHVAFVEAAINRLELDVIYVLPEPVPWRKFNLTELKHRQAMVDLAFKDTQKVATSLDGLKDSNDVDGTLHVLSNKHSQGKYFVLMGADEFLTIDKWHNYKKLIDEVDFVVALRTEDDGEELVMKLRDLPARVTKIVTDKATASSTKIRQAVRDGEETANIPEAVRSYIDQNSLYQ